MMKTPVPAADGPLDGPTAATISGVLAGVKVNRSALVAAVVPARVVTVTSTVVFAVPGGLIAWMRPSSRATKLKAGVNTTLTATASATPVPALFAVAPPL